MAKLIKQEKTVEQKTPTDNTETATNPVEAKVDGGTGETEKAAEGPQIDNTAENATIPDYVDRILKMFSNYAKLAVDAQGGVYTEDSQLLSKGKAILYQNPYYKQ